MTCQFNPCQFVSSHTELIMTRSIYLKCEDTIKSCTSTSKYVTFNDFDVLRLVFAVINKHIVKEENVDKIQSTFVSLECFKRIHCVFNLFYTLHVATKLSDLNNHLQLLLALSNSYNKSIGL